MDGIKGKKVLVTGADGFIGSHLVEKLIKEGAIVRALVYYNSWESIGLLNEIPQIENKAEIVFGDVRDPHFCLQLAKEQEYIFHLAALIAIPYSYVAPSSYFETNVLGTVNLLEASKRENKIKRFIHTSTSETYGTALYSPMDEKHELQAQSPYAASKVGADKAALSYLYSFGSPVTIVRPFNNFGPRQTLRAVIPTMITQLISGKTKTVKIGSIKPIRDYTFVADTADAFIKCALSEKTIGEILNVGTGVGYSIGEIYDMLRKITGKRKNLETDEKRIRPEKSEVWKLICDNSKIKTMAGWVPKTKFEAGLKITVDWLTKNINKYRPEEYRI
ncbi:SDR family NAD(P)-dependent oxidoreductase [Candidatus Woesebacteria bacterium]|nr:SDR family NAD(P)-dependent oxidoreductase [Candidatus Woesebacteria bacterium]